MPAANINVLRGHPRAELRRLVVEVSDIIARVIDAPKDRLEVWVTEIDPDLWGVCGEPASDVLQRAPLADVEMPFIQMVLLAGRPKSQHSALIADISAAVARILGARQDRVRVHIAEASPESWGVGGIPAAVRRADEIRARAEAAASGAT